MLGYEHMSPGPDGSQKRALGLMELEFQAGVSHFTRFPGTKVGLREEQRLRAISLVLTRFFSVVKTTPH